MRSSFIRQTLLIGSFYLASTHIKPIRERVLPLALSPFKTQLAFADAQEERPYLGCSLRSMLDSPGMMVILVNTESPAWHGEMKVADVLLEIDGRPINQIKDYYEAVRNAHGKRLRFLVNRKGQNL